MKAGDIILIDSDTGWGKPIKTLTSSDWSHVAIAINSTDVIEAISDGVTVRRFEKCIEGVKKYEIWERIDPLKEIQSENFNIAVNDFKNEPYNYMLAFFSGASPFFVRLFQYLGLIFMLLSAYSYSAGQDIRIIYALLFFASMCFFVGVPLAYLIKLELDENGKKRSINISKNIKIHFQGFFCSQLAIEIDKRIDGDFYKHAPNGVYLRPKDIRKFLVESKKYLKNS